MTLRGLFGIAVVFWGMVARGDGGQRLRLASIAPEGTAWAREIYAFGRDVSTQTSGALQVKWYMGGIAGDDVEMGHRMERGQLEGGGSAGHLCERLSPTLRALRVA